MTRRERVVRVGEKWEIVSEGDAPNWLSVRISSSKAEFMSMGWSIAKSVRSLASLQILRRELEEAVEPLFYMHCKINWQITGGFLKRKESGPKSHVLGWCLMWIWSKKLMSTHPKSVHVMEGWVRPISSERVGTQSDSLVYFAIPSENTLFCLQTLGRWKFHEQGFIWKVEESYTVE